MAAPVAAGTATAVAPELIAAAPAIAPAVTGGAAGAAATGTAAGIGPAPMIAGPQLAMMGGATAAPEATAGMSLLDKMLIGSSAGSMGSQLLGPGQKRPQPKPSLNRTPMGPYTPSVTQLRPQAARGDDIKISDLLAMASRGGY